MKATNGILAYLFLLMGSAFIDSPVFSLFFGIPVFLMGFIFLLKFYFGIMGKEKSKNIQNKILIVCGTILLAGLLGYTAVEYNQFMVAVDRGEKLESHLLTSIPVKLLIPLNIVAWIIIFFGISQNNHRKKSLIFLWCLPVLLLIPLSIILIKIEVITNIWFGG